MIQHERAVNFDFHTGAYLLDDDTVRFVFQSESYGPLNWWCREVGCGDSYPFIVNTETGATFTG